MVTDDEKTGGWSCSECALDPEADFYKKKRAVIRRRRGFGQVRGKLPPKVGWWPSDQVILAMKLGVIAFSQIKTLSTLKMIRDHWTISVGHYHLFLKWKNSNTVCDSSKQSSSNILFFTEKQLFPDGRLQNKTGMATTKIVFGGSTIRWAVPWQPTEVPSPSLRRVRLACWLGARWYANNQPFTHLPGRPLRINFMSRYICFSQIGLFDVSFEDLFSKAKIPGGFFRKIVF